MNLKPIALKRIEIFGFIKNRGDFDGLFLQLNTDSHKEIIILCQLVCVASAKQSSQ